VPSTKERDPDREGGHNRISGEGRERKSLWIAIGREKPSVSMAIVPYPRTVREKKKEKKYHNTLTKRGSSLDGGGASGRTRDCILR